MSFHILSLRSHDHLDLMLHRYCPHQIHADDYRAYFQGNRPSRSQDPQFLSLVRLQEIVDSFDVNCIIEGMVG